MASFESTIEKEDKPSFIYIKESKDERMMGMEDDERFKEMQSRMLDFLNDSNLIAVLNEKFNCYRFDLAADSIVFKGVTYKKGELLQLPAVALNTRIKRKTLVAHSY